MPERERLGAFSCERMLNGTLHTCLHACVYTCTHEVTEDDPKDGSVQSEFYPQRTPDLADMLMQL